MWDEIAVGFDGEETANFGQKHETTHGNQIFETHTIATISTSQQITKNPEVYCATSQLCVVVAVDNQVSVLNGACYELMCNLKLDSTVDCLALSDDSEILLVGENGGILHIMHIPTQTKLLSMPLVVKHEAQKRSFTSAFTSFNNEGLMNICVLTSQNLIFVFSNLNSFDLYKAIEEGDINKVFNDVKQKQIDLSSLCPGFIPSYLYDLCEEKSIIIGLAGGGTYCLLNVLEDESYFGMTSRNQVFSGGNISKACCTKDKRYLVALDSENHINVICADTLIFLMTWKERMVQDFVLSEVFDQSSYSVTDCKISLLLCPENEQSFEKKCCFQIRQFPSFELIYTIDLLQYTKLANIKANQDYIYIVEGETDCLVGNEIISTIRIRAVSESLPETRLMQLLNKRKFSEADQFAQSFGLDTQVIYKTMVTCALEDLSPYKTRVMTKNEMDMIINNLKDAMSKIQDMEFIKSCLCVHLPSLADTKQFLLFTRSLLDKYQSGKEQKEKLMTQINQSLNRMFTYEILLESNSINIVWYDFLIVDLQDPFHYALKIGQMNTAFTLWERHKGEIVSSFDEEKIETILQSIPDSIHSKYLVPFLRDSFLPTIFRNVCTAVDIVAGWLMQKTYMLEMTEKEYWPENGRQMLEIFPAVCDNLKQAFKRGGTCFSTNLMMNCIHRKTLDNQSVVGHLVQLIPSLQKLLMLKKEFGCQLTLADFCQEDKTAVLFLILDRIEVKLMSRAMTQFLCGFMSENHLEVDACLVQYIKDVLQTSPYTWWHWEEAPWEERLLTIIDCIQDQNQWMEATMAAVFQAPMPWSMGIKKLVQTGLALDHPRNEDLKIQSKLVGLKLVLMKYDLRNFPINNDIHLANVLIKYIFKQNLSTAVEDVLEVVHAYDMLDIDAYMSNLTFLLQNGKLDSMMELLTSMVLDNASVCCKRLLRHAVLNLDDSTFIQYRKSYIHSLTKGALLLMHYLKRFEISVEEDILVTLTTLSRLQEEFDIYVPIGKLSSSTYCWQLLLSSMDSLLHGHAILKKNTEERKCSYATPACCHIYRLGDILHLSREQVMSKMLLKLVQRNESKLVADLCSELVDCYPTPETAKLLMTAVKHFYEEFTSIQKCNLNMIIDTIYQLLCLAVSYCDEKLLDQYVTVSQWFSLLTVINNLSGPQIPWNSGTSQNNTDPYNTWKFSSLYSDEGLWVDMDKVIPLLTQCLPHHLHVPGIYEEKKIDPLVPEKIIQFSGDLIMLLREKGQEQAAFKVLMHMSTSFLISISTQGLEEDTSHSSTLPTAAPHIETVSQDIAYSILRRVTDRRKVDLPLVLGFISILGQKKAHHVLKDLLKSCSADIQRVLAVVTVGIEYAKCKTLTSVAMELDEIYTRALWGAKLGKLSILVKNVMYPLTDKEKWNLVEEMISSKKIEVTTIQDYCLAFNLDPDDALIVYLKHLLLGSEVQQWIHSTTIPMEKLSIILRQAQRVIEDIKNQEVVMSTLKTVLCKANPYNYEILLFIHEQLFNICASLEINSTDLFFKGIELLKFLQVYNRISPPSELELDDWLADNPQHDKVPAIATYRLPFHPLTRQEVCKIINPELMASTAEVWLSVSHLIKVPPDQLLMVAVKNTVSSYIAKQKSAGNSHWVTCTPDFNFLSTLHNLCQRIQNIEMAVACASWVTNRMPPGANKVLSAKAAVILAKKWATGSSEKRVKEASLKLTYLYQKLAIELTLHTFNLAAEDNLALLQQPKQLIQNLIENSCIVNNNSHKVYQAVQKIGDTISCDVIEIYINFLCKWLAPSQTVISSADESFLYPASPIFEDLNCEDKDEENLQRAISILLGTPEDVLIHLLRVIIDRSSCENAVHKTRALCCLFAVGNPQIITTVSGCESSELRQHLQLMMCLSELETLHLPYSVEIFTKSSKLELAERILTSHSHNSKGILLCVKLCLEYQLWHSHLWQVILQRMKEMFMIQELQEVLYSVEHIAHLWHNSTFIQSWNYLLLTPFKRGISGLPSTDILQNIYITLLRCPCSCEVDVMPIWDELKQTNLLPSDFNCLEKDDGSAVDSSAFLLMLTKYLQTRKESSSISYDL